MSRFRSVQGSLGLRESRMPAWLQQLALPVVYEGAASAYDGPGDSSASSGDGGGAAPGAPAPGAAPSLPGAPGAPPMDPESHAVAFQLRNSIAAMPPMGGAAFQKPNPLTLTGNSNLTLGWTRMPRFDGPVLIVPLAAVTSAALLAFPTCAPSAAEELMAVRSRGGILYVPTGGTWFVKYNANLYLNVVVIDARNPAVLSWYMQQVSGTSVPGTWQSMIANGASQQVAIANPNRSTLGLQALEQSVVINFGAAAAYTAGVSVAGFLLTAANGPIWFSDELLDKRAFHVIRATGANGILAWCESVD